MIAISKTLQRVLLLTIILLNVSIISAQKLDIKKIKRFYKALEQRQEGRTSFIQSSMNLLEQPQNISQIMLIRHGVPAISREGRFNRKEAQKFIRAYDSVGVFPLAHQPVHLEEGEVEIIYTSNINRAIHTAQLIFGEQYNFVQWKQFAEFQRKIMAFPNMKMPLGFWLVNSRLLWVLGFNDKGIENFKTAKQRAKDGASFLEAQAMQQDKAILVAHGFYNKYLRKYLKKRGWYLIKSGGQEHLGTSLLIKAK